MNLSFKEKYIIVDKGKICYSLWGNLQSETCLVFLNGAFHGKDAWENQQTDNLLCENYKMIFIDYRGVGLSSFNKKEEFTFDDIIEDIRMVIRAEGLQKINLIGFSIGGLFSLGYSYKFPLEVDKLILLNTGCEISSVANQILISLKRDRDLNEYLKCVANWNYSQNYLEKAVCLDEIEKHINYKRYKSIFLNLLLAIKNKTKLENIIENVKVPVLLVGGNKDNIFPVSSQKELYAKLKNRSLYILNNCGHASFIEKWNEINYLIRNFIDNKLFLEGRTNYIVQSQV